MFIGLMETNPGMVEVLGLRRGFATIEREIERMKKTKKLEVSLQNRLMHSKYVYLYIFLYDWLQRI